LLEIAPSGWVTIIDDVPASNVSVDPKEKDIPAARAPTVTVLPFNKIDLVLEVSDVNALAVILKLLAVVVKVPLITLKVFNPKFKLSPRDTVELGALIVKGKSNVLPLEVIVPVAPIATPLVPEPTVIPVDTVKLPFIVRELMLTQVPENPVKLREPIFTAIWTESVPAVTLTLGLPESVKLFTDLVPTPPE
jgi:hypothetical protein